VFSAGTASAYNYNIIYKPDARSGSCLIKSTVLVPPVDIALSSAIVL
jgi:hypothetical protein